MCSRHGQSHFRWDLDTGMPPPTPLYTASMWPGFIIINTTAWEENRCVTSERGRLLLDVWVEWIELDTNISFLDEVVKLLSMNYRYIESFKKLLLKRTKFHCIFLFTCPSNLRLFITKSEVVIISFLCGKWSDQDWQLWWPGPVSKSLLRWHLVWYITMVSSTAHCRITCASIAASCDSVPGPVTPQHSALSVIYSWYKWIQICVGYLNKLLHLNYYWWQWL